MPDIQILVEFIKAWHWFIFILTLILQGHNKKVYDNADKKNLQAGNPFAFHRRSAKKITVKELRSVLVMQIY